MRCGTTRFKPCFSDYLLYLLYVAKCNLGEVKIEAIAGQWCPQGWGMWGRPLHFAGAPGLLQLTCLCQFISHLFTCRSSCCLRLLLLFRPVFSFYVFVISRNTNNSLHARLFADDAPSTADGSSSTLCETLTADGTFLPSTTASATLAASAVPPLSPEIIILIT